MKDHEEQHALWPADRVPPDGGWKVGQRGTKAEWLAWSDAVWTGMRPLSPREPAPVPERLERP